MAFGYSDDDVIKQLVEVITEAEPGRYTVVVVRGATEIHLDGQVCLRLLNGSDHVQAHYGLMANVPADELHATSYDLGKDIIDRAMINLAKLAFHIFSDGIDPFA